MERRRRPLTGISGLVLFVCMFVPAWRGCNHEAIIPIQIPFVIPPYLLGLGFAIAALRVKGGLKGPTIYLRVVLILFLVECLIAFAEEPNFGVVLLLAPTLMLGILGFKRYSDRRIAGASIICGIGSAIWFGLFCGDHDTLIGVWLSLFASIGLAIGGLVWLVDPDPEDDGFDLPRATVISSGQ